MNYQEKEEKLRQIISGFFHFEFNGKLFKYFEPTSIRFSEISFFTKNLEADLRKDGFLTEEDETRILTERGLWSKKNESDLKTCHEDLEKLKLEKPKYRYKSNHLKVMENTIKVLEEKIKELESVKNSMFTQTVEYQKAYRTSVFLLSECVRNIDGSKVWESLEDLELNVGVGDIDKILRKINSSTKLSQKDIRELARSEPWRTVWKTSCKTGTPLFSSPASNMTKSQYEICYWSNVYDSVYESPDYPGSDVVDDDDLLDDWFLEQSAKYNKNKTKNDLKLNKKIAQAGEVFLVVDTQEDAEKVYEEMNSPQARKILKDRTKLLEEKGSVREDEFADVKQGLAIELNKLAMTKR